MLLILGDEWMSRRTAASPENCAAGDLEISKKGLLAGEKVAFYEKLVNANTEFCIIYHGIPPKQTGFVSPAHKFKGDSEMDVGAVRRSTT